jgi:hypothetical protein
MKFLKINCVVGVEVEDEKDPEEVAGEFEAGLDEAVSAFPGGEVWGADVASIEPLTDEERNERGWIE